MIYDKIADSNASNKLQKAAFPSQFISWGQTPPAAVGSPVAPYVHEIELQEFMCPSFPGEETSTLIKDALNLGSRTDEVGISNYVTLAATHYTNPAAGDAHLANSGVPATSNPNDPESCSGKTYCGNGTIVFPGLVGARVTLRGLGMQSVSDGTSNTVMIAESREPLLTSWYSGVLSFAVGTWPRSGMPTRSTLAGPTNGRWYINPAGTVAHALNKGSDRETEEPKWYMAKSNGYHGVSGTSRKWGPSSAHSGGVIIHGYLDGHARSVNEDVDPTAYIHMITRNGREVEESRQ